MTGVHMQRLIFRHCSEVLHGKQILRPVLKYSAVTSICNQLVGMLRHCRIQVVLDHHHNCSSLHALEWIFPQWPCIDRVGWPETVHVDPAVLVKLFKELRCQDLVMPRVKIAQGIFNGKLLFYIGKDVLSPWCMADQIIVRLDLWKFIRYSDED